MTGASGHRSMVPIAPVGRGRLARRSKDRPGVLLLTPVPAIMVALMVRRKGAVSNSPAVCVPRIGMVRRPAGRAVGYETR